jgi:hypothetical protein
MVVHVATAWLPNHRNWCRGLEEMLGTMQHFECADVRDKLYGILALVDWPGNAPTPDYDKTDFEVAVEVLQIYLDQKVHSSRSGRIFSWSEKLGRIFDLTCQDDALQKAIKVRCPRSVIPLALMYNRRSLEIDMRISGDRLAILPGAACHLWFCVRLRKAKNFEKKSSSGRTNHLYYAGPTAEQRLGRVFDQQGRHFAYVPSCTQPGDWLLSSIESYMSCPRIISITVRSSQQNKGNHYTIIGQASISNKMYKRVLNLGAQFFHVRWNAEDLLVLYWTLSGLHVIPSGRKRACGLSGDPYMWQRRLIVC